MIQTRKEQLSDILRLAAEALDMPEQLYQEAVKKYKEVGRWLGADDSILNDNSPEIYPQGSFRLGTITRPPTDKDEYDIDLVCLLQLKKQSVSQKDLKKRVGDRLRQNEKYQCILEESRRCWILNFGDQFHIDALPAIPDEEGRFESILITDKDLTLWQHSNPKGYADWFYGQMKVIFEQEKRLLAEVMKANIEDIPDWKIKTPLQRVIQLLKRHRDLHFKNDWDDRPVSIIITTLAALAYSGGINLFESLIEIVHRMPDHIQRRNGIYWVGNPVHDRENFADKWRENPKRRDKFIFWLKKVEDDVMIALEKQGIHQVAAALEAGFGKSIISRAAKNLGDTVLQQRQAGKLYMTAGSGTLGSAGTTQVRSHTFYGESTETESP